jgi:hypothetical protein
MKKRLIVAKLIAQPYVQTVYVPTTRPPKPAPKTALFVLMGCVQEPRMPGPATRTALLSAVTEHARIQRPMILVRQIALRAVPITTEMAIYQSPAPRVMIAMTATTQSGVEHGMTQ